MKKTNNTLKAIIEAYEQDRKTPFKPNRAFFSHIRIGSRRFWQLVRNEKPMMFDEMIRLSKYFGVHLLELHECTLKFVPKGTDLTIQPKPNILEKQGMVRAKA